jgi:hypothetical protein
MDELLALETVVVNDETVYVNRFGDLWRWKRTSNRSHTKFMKIVTKPSRGYIHPKINGKHVKQHRIIAAAFLGLDITDLKIQVDHINGIRHDNRLENLRLVTNQQNSFNQTKAKGYGWNKQLRKWRAGIGVDGKSQHLGYFDTEEEARDAYLEAKSRLHIITKANG